MRRGDVYRFRLPKGIGHEHHGERFGVVVQADEFLPRSVVIVAPTSRSARAASFRPKIDIAGALGQAVRWGWLAVNPAASASPPYDDGQVLHLDEIPPTKTAWEAHRKQLRRAGAAGRYACFRFDDHYATLTLAPVGRPLSRGEALAVLGRMIEALPFDHLRISMGEAWLVRMARRPAPSSLLPDMGRGRLFRTRALAVVAGSAASLALLNAARQGAGASRHQMLVAGVIGAMSGAALAAAATGSMIKTRRTT